MTGALFNPVPRKHFKDFYFYFSGHTIKHKAAIPTQCRTTNYILLLDPLLAQSIA